VLAVRGGDLFLAGIGLTDCHLSSVGDDI